MVRDLAWDGVSGLGIDGEALCIADEHVGHTVGVADAGDVVRERLPSGRAQYLDAGPAGLGGGIGAELLVWPAGDDDG